MVVKGVRTPDASPGANNCLHQVAWHKTTGGKVILILRLLISSLVRLAGFNDFVSNEVG
jgi:hypothetical protein